MPRMVICQSLIRRCTFVRHVYKQKVGVLQLFTTNTPDRTDTVDKKANDPASAFTDKLQRKTEDELLQLMGQPERRGQPEHRNVQLRNKVCIRGDKACHIKKIPVMGATNCIC